MRMIKAKKSKATNECKFMNKKIWTNHFYEYNTVKYKKMMLYNKKETIKGKKSMLTITTFLDKSKRKIRGK